MLLPATADSHLHIILVAKNRLIMLPRTLIRRNLLTSSTRSFTSLRPARLSRPILQSQIQSQKRSYAVAAPAVGAYDPTSDDASGERTINSPSELARRISAKVLPRLEKPDVKKVLVVGSGGLSIGQAGEFDYSGECAFGLFVCHRGGGGRG